jgi:cysteine desulfurase
MIYFDNASTTKLSTAVIQQLPYLVTNEYGNSSSNHFIGKQASELQEDARNEIANILDCESSYLYFTSGATEAANIVIQGYAKYLLQTGDLRNEIIISSIEHPCVFDTAHSLELLGFRVKHLPVDNYGEISLDRLDSLITDKTALIALIAVNNEVGVIQDINGAAKLTKSRFPEILFLVDLVQLAGKLPFDLDLDFIDSFFMSGHKFGAPKGVGLFYLNDNFRILPTIFGGGQESSYRPGTSNVTNIFLMKVALQSAILSQGDNYLHVHKLNQYLTDELNKYRIKYERTIPIEKSSPYILSISILGQSANFLEINLSKKGICVSTKSACSSNSHKSSRILDALGIERAIASSVLRLSFSHENTLQEVESFVQTLVKIIEVSPSILEKVM